MTTLREAAQMALDALDSDNPDIQLRAATHLRAALAQPEQEPVAYDINGATVYIKPPVYGAAPPQRECAGTAHDRKEWQGLTDEERKEIIRKQKDFWGPVGWELECAKAIEAKLKEKNGL